MGPAGHAAADAGMKVAASVDGVVGPGSGPGGVPAAIALSPILSARYRPGDLQRIREAAPDSRLVSVSAEGLADTDLSDVEVLLRGPLPPATFDRLVARCPRLRWVHSASVGVERVLTPTALARGVAITNARGVFSQPIAEYVLMMMLAICRRLPQLLELQRERTWQPLEAVELRERTIGIVGLGSIGRAVAGLANAFGPRVIAVRRREVDEHMAIGEDANADPRIDALLPSSDLTRLLRESDFVVLAVPLTPDTKQLIDADALAAMKPGSWLINVARGALVDERALVRALRDGPIGGAVLDTFSEEPLASDSPFYGLPNVVVTPHTSWSSGRVLDRSIELFCDNLGRFRRGERLRNLVDPNLGY